MRASKAGCDMTVASIFVNPMQFGPNEDFDAYPRTLDSDLAKLKNESVDYLFAPTVREMYPDGVNTQIEVPSLGNILEGASRPGHFAGVATVVAKLFNIVQSDIAYFGRKDYQQLAVIRRMVMDLLLPIQIQGVATGRAADGLALSSRNAYLSDSERQQAPAIYAALQWAGQQIRQGNLNYGMIEREAAAQIDDAGLKTDYFEIRCAQNLTAPGHSQRELVILTAAQLGKARLIDNLEVTAP
jgi:pantoate--beta-alanine ligase